MANHASLTDAQSARLIHYLGEITGRTNNSQAKNGATLQNQWHQDGDLFRIELSPAHYKSGPDRYISMMKSRFQSHHLGDGLTGSRETDPYINVTRITLELPVASITAALEKEHDKLVRLQKSKSPTVDAALATLEAEQAKHGALTLVEREIAKQSQTRAADYWTKLTASSDQNASLER